MKKLVIDGYLNGTGIRDKIHGGYITHYELGISSELSEKINVWLARYWQEFYTQYSHANVIGMLDDAGKKLARELKDERPEDSIEYFSDAKMTYM